MSPFAAPKGPPWVRLILGTIVVLAISGAIIYWLDSISVKTSDPAASAGGVTEDGWTTKLPSQFEGTWVVGGACESESAPLIVLSNGGYRWRDGPTNWGFARGRYKYDSPATNRVRFRLNKLNAPHDGSPDYVITVAGPQLIKYNLKSRTTQEYEKCD